MRASPAVSATRCEPLWTLAPTWLRTGAAIVADLARMKPASTSPDRYKLYAPKTNGKVKWQEFAAARRGKAPSYQRTMVYQHVPDIGMAALDKGEIGDKDHPPTPHPALDDRPTPRSSWRDDCVCLSARLGQQDMALDQKKKNPHNPKKKKTKQKQKPKKKPKKTKKKKTTLNATAARSLKRSDFVASGTKPKDATIYAATRGRPPREIKAVRLRREMGKWCGEERCRTEAHEMVQR